MSLVASWYHRPSVLQRLRTTDRRTYSQRILRRNHILLSARLSRRNCQERQAWKYYRHPTACYRVGNLYHVLRWLWMLLYLGHGLFPYGLGNAIHSGLLSLDRHAIPSSIPKMAGKGRTNPAGYPSSCRHPSRWQSGRSPGHCRMGRNLDRASS